MRKLFTSESVTEGHPDKICDQISDAVLDTILAQDPMARVACETCTTTGIVMVMGEVTTTATYAVDDIVRKVVCDIGYDRAKYGFDGSTCAVLTALHGQSPDIAQGVDEAYDVQQAHPVEYRLGEMAVRGAKKTFGVRLDRHEATGIALSIVNSALTLSERAARREEDVSFLVEGITSIVEQETGITVDRDSFDYARFATHVQYLIDRVSSGEPIDSQNASLYDEIRAAYPAAVECANRASKLIQVRLKVPSLTNEEKLYLILHDQPPYS